MKDLKLLQHYRLINDGIIRDFGEEAKAGSKFGIFVVPFKGSKLRLICSAYAGWDHISVSHRHRIPTWDEMDFIKRMFFNEDEIAIQYHVPSDEHINIHQYCLHLWRPHHVQIPLPPASMV